MAKSRGGLGRGLASLIPTGPQTDVVTDTFLSGRPTADTSARVASPSGTGAGHDANAPHYQEIPVAAVVPNPQNPRTVFDEDALAELAHSIKEFGLLQPVVVRPTGDTFELVMGERRWRAATQAGVATIPAIIRRTEDADMLRDALLENIHRSNLNPLEEAAAYQQLLEEFDVTQDELATRIGRSRPVISNTIRLLALPVAVQRRVAAGVLSAGHARALLSLGDPNEQEELATRIVAEGLSVRGTEEAVTSAKHSAKKRTRPTPPRVTMPAVEELSQRLSDHFDTKVRVDIGRRKGKIAIEFATVADLERIVAIISPELAEKRHGSK